jgi:hypothetical protein
MLDNQCKRRISKRALEKLNHIISASRCGGSAFFPGGSVAQRFHVLAQRLCGPEVPCFSRRLRAVQKQQHEPRKNGSSKQLGLT